MGRKYASDRKIPRRDEQTHAQPEAAPHRARKDRKRWCRGKVGVEHVLVLRISKYGLYRAQTGRSRDEPCGWQHGWKRVNGKATPDFTHWRYNCRHERGCSTCGKIIDPFLGVLGFLQRTPPTSHECPDFTPLDQAKQAFTPSTS